MSSYGKDWVPASQVPSVPTWQNLLLKRLFPPLPAKPQLVARASRSRKGHDESQAASLLATIIAEVRAAVEGIAGGEIGDEQPLMEAGLDSLGRPSILAISHVHS